MLDAVHGQEQFEGVLIGPPAVLSAIVREDRADGHAQRLVEGQDAVVEQVAGGHRHLRGVDLREGEGAEDVDDDLDVDFADALSVPQCGLRRADSESRRCGARAGEPVPRRGRA
jgi:hypothetical protein